MKNNLIKQLISFALGLGISLQLSAQTYLIVTLSNSKIETIAISEIQSIKLGAETLNLHINNGNIPTWNMRDIANYLFEDITRVNNIDYSIRKLSVYPNPVLEQTSIFFASKANQRIRIEGLDILGRSICEIYSGSHFGESSYIW
jgi:hypothetical protein